MESRILTVVNWGILVVITLVAVWVAWAFFSGEEVADLSAPSVEKVCTDVAGLEGVEYEACYDAYSETIFLKASREKDNYDIRGLEVSFVDVASQSYTLREIFGVDKPGAYKLAAKKNPGSMEIELIIGDFVGDVCFGGRVIVDYCPSGVSTGGNVSIAPVGGVEIGEFVDIEDLSGVDSDIIFADVVDKESVWESTCKSNWDCGGWGVCENGVQRRTCRDLNGCAVSVNSPETTRRCDGACVENWACEWGDCRDGFSVPKCKDSNNCGTTFNIPKKLSCGKEKCEPSVVCGEWSGCEVDYDFDDLISGKAVKLEGVRERLCVDKAGCVAASREEEACSLSVDIYTDKFEKCGREYVGVYDSLNDEMLAVLGDSVKDVLSLNIYFGNEDDIYCPYCFDGVMNGDEEGVDCGGSCRGCEVEGRFLKEDHWWDFLVEWFG